MTWTSDDLLTAIKAAGVLPDAYTGAFTDSEILGFANEEMDTRMAPLVRTAASEYWVKSSTSALVADQAAYRINYRSMAAGLRQVAYVDSNGNVSAPLPQIPPDQIDEHLQGASVLWPNGMAFGVREDLIYLVPTPTVAVGSLKQWFYLRRPRLVASTAVAAITAINTSTKTVTCGGGIPSAITSSTPVDLTRAKAPFANLGFDLTGTKSSNDYIFAATLPTELAVGDYLSLADQTYLVPLPTEIYPLLVRAVVGRIQEALGDPRATFNEKKLEGLEQKVAPLLAPRVDGRSPRIVNRHSPLRGGRRLW